MEHLNGWDPVQKGQQQEVDIGKSLTLFNKVLWKKVDDGVFSGGDFVARIVSHLPFRVLAEHSIIWNDNSLLR